MNKNKEMEKEQNRMLFAAIIPAAIIIFWLIYLIKTTGFSFQDHPLLRKILILLSQLIPGRPIPGGRVLEL